MAVDLSAINSFPYYHSIAAAPTTATEIKVPETADLVEVENWDAANDIYIGQNGQTDGGSWVAANQFAIPSKNGKQIVLTKGTGRATSIFVAASTGTIAINLEFSRKG
tara:strand:- start:508 stop:831 length:324 start_codon:yes stop_codon:yes gene_type:complete